MPDVHRRFDKTINVLRPAAMEHFAAKGGDSQAKKNKNKVEPEKPKSEPEKPPSAPRPAAMERPPVKQKDQPSAASTATGEMESIKDVLVLNEGDLIEDEDDAHVYTQELLDQPVHERDGRAVPVAVAYFTRRAEEARVRRLAEARELHLRNMSEAHRHFNKRFAEETERKIAMVDGFIHVPRPAAMEHFAAEGEEPQARKRRGSI